MADPVRFYFDQHLPNLAVTALRRRGVDVRTAYEAGTCSNPDDEQLRYATADGRAMVTFDEDYLVLAADFLTREEPFAGIVYARPERFSQSPSRLAGSC